MTSSNRGVRVRAVTPVVAALTATVSLAAAVFGGGVAGAQPSQGGISDAPAPVPAPSAPAVVPPEAQTPSPAPVIWRASPYGLSFPTAPRQEVPSEIPGHKEYAPLNKHDGSVLADFGDIRDATLTPEILGITAQQVAPLIGAGAAIGAGVGAVPGLGLAIPATLVGGGLGALAGAGIGTTIGVLAGATIGGTVGVLPAGLAGIAMGALCTVPAPGVGTVVCGALAGLPLALVGGIVGTVGGGVIGGAIGLPIGLAIGTGLGAAGLGLGALALTAAPGAAIGAGIGAAVLGGGGEALLLEDYARARAGYEPLPLPLLDQGLYATSKTVSVDAAAAVRAPMDLAGQVTDAVRGFAAQHPQIGQVASGLLDQTIGSIAGSSGSVGDAIGGSVGSLAPASSAPVSAPAPAAADPAGDQLTPMPVITAPSPIDVAIASMTDQVNQVTDTIAAGLGVRL